MKDGRLVVTLRLFRGRPRATRRKARPFPSLALGILVGALVVVVTPNEPRRQGWQAVLEPSRCVDPVGQGPGGLSILRPYERGKIPVVLVHGLWGSERQWDRMVRELEGDDAIRSRYQFWTFSYATGAESILLPGLAAPAGDQPGSGCLRPRRNRRGIQSHGRRWSQPRGLVAKMTAQTTGPDAWRTVAAKHPEGGPGLAEDVRSCKGGVHLRMPAGSARLIFIATPIGQAHRAGCAGSIWDPHLPRDGRRAPEAARVQRRQILRDRAPLEFADQRRRTSSRAAHLTALGEPGSTRRGLSFDHSLARAGDGRRTCPWKCTRRRCCIGTPRPRSTPVFEEREVIRDVQVLAEHVRMSGKKGSSRLALGVLGRRGETWDLGRSGGDTTAWRGQA